MDLQQYLKLKRKKKMQPILTCKIWKALFVELQALGKPHFKSLYGFNDSSLVNNQDKSNDQNSRVYPLSRMIDVVKLTDKGYNFRAP